MLFINVVIGALLLWLWTKVCWKITNDWGPILLMKLSDILAEQIERERRERDSQTATPTQG